MAEILGTRCRAITIALLLLTYVSAIRADTVDVAQSPEQFICHSWESGQRLFYSDPYWRGGDCASTVDLGDGRVLWLFADSYIANRSPYRRDSCCVKMIRNCMGIQHGYDPTIADFAVYNRGTRDDPRAYFPKEDTSWFWPGNAIRLDDVVVVFLMRVCPSDSGLGFMLCGHAAFLISDIDGNPREWSVSRLQLPDSPLGIMLGAATLVEPPYLYLFSMNIYGSFGDAIYLARWHTDSMLANRSDAIEWWAGDSSSWVPNSELTSPPTTLYLDGASEFSVVHDRSTKQYVSIQTVGFGAADVMMRTSPSLTGPWSGLQLVYEPPEKTKPNVMMYAAKAHPEIEGADLIITYNTNGPTEVIIQDTTIYYPRLVRLNWKD